MKPDIFASIMDFVATGKPILVEQVRPAPAPPAPPVRAPLTSPCPFTLDPGGTKGRSGAGRGGVG